MLSVTLWVGFSLSFFENGSGLPNYFVLQKEYVFNFCLIVYRLTTWDITEFSQSRKNKKWKEKKEYWQEDALGILILSWMSDHILIGNFKLFLLFPFYHWLVSSNWCREKKKIVFGWILFRKIAVSHTIAVSSQYVRSSLENHLKNY